MILKNAEQTIPPPVFLQTLPVDLTTLILRTKIQTGIFFTKEHCIKHISGFAKYILLPPALCFSLPCATSVIHDAPRSRRCHFSGKSTCTAIVGVKRC